ncbi:hypothetical protein QQZ08_005851 [Neonectria magnoliae]|uniref:Uncharacterized protein n=1 Tax=Neonectria magnoliae TaxID=2732573 RepID=A0ABR1I3Z1_9HYPO
MSLKPDAKNPANAQTCSAGSKAAASRRGLAQKFLGFTSSLTAHVNNVGQDCSVVLDFANGYAIARHHQHKSHGNRIVISLRSEAQPQLEHLDACMSQAAVA